jgi:hypothetical protein
MNAPGYFRDVTNHDPLLSAASGPPTSGLPVALGFSGRPAIAQCGEQASQEVADGAAATAAAAWAGALRGAGAVLADVRDPSGRQPVPARVACARPSR